MDVFHLSEGAKQPKRQVAQVVGNTSENGLEVVSSTEKSFTAVAYGAKRTCRLAQRVRIRDSKVE